MPLFKKEFHLKMQFILTRVLGGLPLVVSIMVAIAAVIAFFKVIRFDPLSADRIKFLEIEKQVQILSSQNSMLMRQLGRMQAAIDEATVDPNNFANINLLSDIKQLSAEMKSLKDALGSDVERTLSVPLMRKDMQKLEERLEERNIAASKEIDRIYDQNKWFLGLMVTMAIGLLGLALSNFLQTRKKELNA